MTHVVGAVGKVVVDEVVRCQGPPRPDTHQNVIRLVTPGGGPANVTAQLAAHGRRAFLAGWAGADAASAQVIDDLTRTGVTVRLVRRDRGPVATVLTWDGDRAFLVDQGTLRAHLDDLQDTWLDGLAVVHLNGFELLDYCWPEVLAEVAARAHARGIAVSVDCPTANRIASQGAESFRAALAAVAPDIVFGNAREARVLGLDAGRQSWPKVVVVHDGTHPTTVHHHGGTSQHPVTEVVADPETTGCGDAFAAGFLDVWAAGGDVCAAVRQAHDWAAEQARVPGAQPRSA